MTVLDVGEKVLLIERRLFETDLRRHFVGVVERCTEVAFRLRGYVFVYDRSTGGFVRRGDRRIRIAPLAGRYVISVLPAEVDIEELRYVAPAGIGLTLTDGKQFSMLLTEFGAPARGSSQAP
jgi:hypothetical protein